MRRRFRHDDRGTVLLLFPAAVFVMCVLAALVVDTAHATMLRRELQNAADAAANNAAALGIDAGALRAGATVIDSARAEAIVNESLAHQNIRGVVNVEVRVENDDTVVVELHAVHPSVFARAIPGADPEVRVPARARARALASDTPEVPR
jgi:Flp pilus assembly protein TadG